MGIDPLFLILAVLPMAAWWSGWRLGRNQASTDKKPGSAWRSATKWRWLNGWSEYNDAHHFQLWIGQMFRFRGETRQAIETHKAIADHPEVGTDIRDDAMLELAQDYLNAGLLDWAEHIYNKLMRNRQLECASLKGLLQIYEQEKEWSKAIFTAERLQSLTRNPMLQVIIAHYLCEQAEHYVVMGQRGDALEFLKRSLEKNPTHVRAHLMRGRLLLELGEVSRAQEALVKALHDDTRYIGEILPALIRCSQVQNQPQFWLSQLQGLASVEFGGAFVFKALQDSDHGKMDADQIQYIETRWLLEYPSLSAVVEFIRLRKSCPEDVQADTLSMVEDALEKLVDKVYSYKCNSCGFMAKHLHWQCPSCKDWNTILPSSN